MAIYSGFSHQKWWFSIAMLVHQRVFSKGSTFPVKASKVRIFWAIPSIHMCHMGGLWLPTTNISGKCVKSSQVSACRMDQVMGCFFPGQRILDLQGEDLRCLDSHGTPKNDRPQNPLFELSKPRSRCFSTFLWATHGKKALTSSSSMSLLGCWRV